MVVDLLCFWCIVMLMRCCATLLQDTSHLKHHYNFLIQYVSRQPPEYEIPESIDFFKTIIAGFPSGDKRLTFVQMEALTGWSAKDEWDFEYLGMTNHPFIKANYPHHGK